MLAWLKSVLDPFNYHPFFIRSIRKISVPFFLENTTIYSSAYIYMKSGGKNKKCLG